MASMWSFNFLSGYLKELSGLHCRARDDLEEERLARIDAEDVVSKLQEQLAEVQNAEVSARQAAETRLSSLTQEYESMKGKVSICNNTLLNI